MVESATPADAETPAADRPRPGRRTWRGIELVNAIRYVTPLREGGSLPAIVEADGLGTYVAKFVGAGQGRKALVAEIVAGEIARRLGFRVPDLVLVNLDPAIGRVQPDQECRSCWWQAPGSTWALTSSRVRLVSSPRPGRWTPASPLAWCGSTRSSATSTAAGATPTCWSGTARSG